MRRQSIFSSEHDVPAFKIASFENNHLPLIKKAASTGKPLIISTGMATLGELEQTVTTARDAGCDQLILLKCTSNYPAKPENNNIATIPHLKQLFGTEVGLSDHTMGVGVAVASVALGASVIEKHFTLSRADGGVDSAFLLEPRELKELVVESERAWQAWVWLPTGLLMLSATVWCFADRFMSPKTSEKVNCLRLKISGSFDQVTGSSTRSTQGSDW